MGGQLRTVNVTSLDALASNGITRACIAIGVFDGVHCGHQLLIKTLTAMADEHNATPVALTFYPHPREVLSPENPPPLLVPPWKRIDLLHYYGAEAVVTLSFSASFARQSPEDFIRNCLYSPRVEIKGICVGSNWRFGANGSGGIEVLEHYAAQGHFAFQAVDELAVDGMPVSSTSIRRAIASGLLNNAEKMLGRPYSLCGIVEKGHSVAGRELGSPTANLKVSYGVMPPAGVYAATAVFDDRRMLAAVNIGNSPTYNRPEDANGRLEVHIINFYGNIYGKMMEIEFHEYLREERCFSSPSELKVQVIKDIEQIETFFNSNKSKQQTTTE
ncbi:MAG: riboflavin biosynthesis protein RibF [Victivallaceae bacterium]